MRARDPYRIDSHKMLYHPDRVAQWKAAGDDWEKQKEIFPIYVEISPSGSCNHRCTFCAVDYIGYEKRQLDRELLNRTLSNMAEHGVRSVMFAGEGEPLLMKGLSESIIHAKKVGIDVAITTNATPLTAKFVDECLGAISWIKASVNAGTSATHAKIHRTREGDFDLVWKNLSYAAEHRRKHSLQTRLGVQMVLIPENALEIDALCGRAKSAGMDYVVIKPYSQHLSSTTTAERGYDDVDYSEFYEIAENLKRWNDDAFHVVFRRNTMESLAETSRYYNKCYSTPSFWAYVMANGDVYGCSAYLLDDRFRYGNLNDASFAEIWRGEKRRQNFEHVRQSLNISECRKNCRMEHVNRYLWDIANPPEHVNFI